MFCILFSCATEPKRLELRKIPRLERKGLIVFNFKNNTQANRSRQFQPWEFGLASMMMTDLESIGLFNIISQEKMREISKKKGLQLSSIQTEADTLEVGKLVGAKYVLSGSFVEMKGKLRLEARVFSIEKGMQLGAASVTGRTDKYFELEKQLVLKVSKYLEAMLDEAEASIIVKNIETTSINASLNNYAGEIAVFKADEMKERGKTNEAEALLVSAEKKFRTALRYDPNYERAKRNLAKLVMGIPMTL